MQDPGTPASAYSSSTPSLTPPPRHASSASDAASASFASFRADQPAEDEIETLVAYPDGESFDSDSSPSASNLDADSRSHGDNGNDNGNGSDSDSDKDDDKDAAEREYGRGRSNPPSFPSWNGSPKHQSYSFGLLDHARIQAAEHRATLSALLSRISAVSGVRKSPASSSPEGNSTSRSRMNPQDNESAMLKIRDKEMRKLMGEYRAKYHDSETERKTFALENEKLRTEVKRLRSKVSEQNRALQAIESELAYVKDMRLRDGLTADLPEVTSLAFHVLSKIIPYVAWSSCENEEFKRRLLNDLDDLGRRIPVGDAYPVDRFVKLLEDRFLTSTVMSKADARFRRLEKEFEKLDLLHRNALDTIEKLKSQVYAKNEGEIMQLGRAIDVIQSVVQAGRSSSPDVFDDISMNSDLASAWRVVAVRDKDLFASALDSWRDMLLQKFDPLRFATAKKLAPPSSQSPSGQSLTSPRGGSASKSSTARTASQRRSFGYAAKVDAASSQSDQNTSAGSPLSSSAPIRNVAEEQSVLIYNMESVLRDAEARILELESQQQLWFADREKLLRRIKWLLEDKKSLLLERQVSASEPKPPSSPDQEAVSPPSSLTVSDKRPNDIADGRVSPVPPTLPDSEASGALDNSAL
eukprot:ANDGO_04913.mRNA.1 hypothetical protein